MAGRHVGGLVVLVACLVTIVAGGEARAGWHHRYAHGCSACGGSCGSSGGSVGHHVCRRCRHHASHGSSGGSSGGCSGGSSGGDAKTADASKEKDSKDGKDAKKAAAAGVPADGLVLVVELPEDATLLVNGRETSLSGAVRSFVSAGLAEDLTYDYEVTMRVERDGTAIEKTRVVSVSGGQRHVVAFDAPVADPVQTLVTLRVPEAARVWIEGQATSKEGALREFRTRALARGESWEGYEIKVTVTVDGREVTAVKRIDLVGGSAVEVSIDPAALLATGEAEIGPVAAAAPLDATAQSRSCSDPGAAFTPAA